MEFSLAWPSISKSFGATGRFVWHDEPLDMTLTLGDFPAALAGNRTGMKLRIAGSPMKAAFEGAISVKPTLKIEGTLAADAASLRNALIWAGQQPLPGGGFGHFAIKAQTNVMGGTIGLSNVNVELDGNTAEGVLTFATDGRKTLQGTLASDTLDLTPYVSTVRLLTANQREWNNTRITLDGLSGIDLDLRLSAANVVMSNAKLGRTAIGANLRGGHLVVTVGEAQAYGGVIKGSLTLANFDAGVDVKSQLQFTDVDLESCLGQLFGLHRLEGKGNMALRGRRQRRQRARGHAHLERHRQPDRPKWRARRPQCRAIAAPAGAAAAVRRRRIPQRAHPVREDRDGAEDQPGHGHGRGREDRGLGGAAGACRLGLDPGARTRSQGHRRPGGRQQARGDRLRTAVHRAGLVGRPDHAARSGGADPPLRRGRPAAQCGARSARARRGALGDRAADRRPRRRHPGGRAVGRPGRRQKPE